MKCVNILLVFALAISIGPTMQMEVNSRSRVPPNSWLSQKIGLLRNELNAIDLGHLRITHFPDDDHQVMITDEQNENGLLGDRNNIKRLLKTLNTINVEYSVTELPSGRKSYATVHFRNPPSNLRQPISLDPSEGLSSQTPSKRKFNQE